MLEREKRPTRLLNSTDELRKLILGNPDLPMLCFVSDDANIGDYTYMSASCHATLGEFLDCMQEVKEDRCYTDRDEFGEDLADCLYDNEYHDWDGTDNEWDAYVEKRIAEYDPYWRKCIILYVDNG